MKKFLALALAFIMVFALATTAMAAEVTINSDNNEGAAYKAYKLLDLTTVLNCAEGHTHTDNCYGFAYTINSKYSAAITAVTGVTAAASGKTLDETVVEKLAAMSGREVADDFYAQVKKMDADATLTEGAAADLAQGYWLIVQTSQAASEATKSLVMLDTAGQEKVDIIAKDDTMTLGKTVDKVNAELGEEVTFTLTSAPIPTKIADYTTYTFIVTDTMSKGLSYVDNSLEVKVGNTSLSTSDYTLIVGDYSETEGTTITINAGAYILANDPADQIVTVTYRAVVNGNAVMGSTGNPNSAILEFTNDPSDNQTGKTVPTEVKVYTSEIVIDKFAADATADDNTDNTRLAGAKFVLKNGNSDNAKFYKIKDNVVSWVDAQSEATEVTTDETGAAKFVGLKAGTYYLVETAAPAGYNMLAEPVAVEIKESDVVTVMEKDPETDDSGNLVYDEDGNQVMKEKEVTKTINYPNVTKPIENRTGTELPSTGGMGTTVFYIIGAVLMLGAVVVLVSRKRMAA